MDITIQEIQAKFVEQVNQTSDTAFLDVQVLLAHYLEKPRSWIMAHPEVSLTSTQYNKLCQAVDRLSLGEPLPYVIGHWEFYGLDFKLTPDVLIPRPETEILVERAINWLQLHPHKRNAIDVGTGSGCIGISLVKHIPDLHMVLTDVSLQALNVARENAGVHGLSDRLVFKEGNLIEGVSGPFDLICANLPYIPTDLLLTLPVNKKEPRIALDGGSHGTDLIVRMLEQARHHLVTGGVLLLEIESSQGDTLGSLARNDYPHSIVSILKDLSAQDRCLEIQRPDLLVHICPQSEWIQAQKNGIYRDTSLEQDGFIHCSQPEQVMEVANHFYLGVRNLVMLWIDPEILSSKICWEFVDGTMFPHIYGPINLDAVKSISNLETGIDGTFRNIQLPD
jgi:release factor glutamine methyltransferase